MILESTLESDIISLYDSNLKSVFSIHQIAKKLNKRYPYINKKMGQLINADIVKKTIIGRSHLCSLNLKSESTRLLLTINGTRKKQEFVRRYGIDSNSVLASLPADTMPHTIIVVRNDIYAVCEHPTTEHTIIKGFRVHLITFKELERLILDAKEPVFNDHVILSGLERFYETIAAMDTRLTMQYSPLVIP